MGRIEAPWLTAPIVGPATRVLLDRLRCGPVPHVVHFLGHGGIDNGVPALRADEMRLPGTVQLWPHRQQTDAMFFALLRRAG